MINLAGSRDRCESSFLCTKAPGNLAAPQPFALVIAFAGPAKSVGKHVVRLQLSEDRRSLAHPIAEDARNGNARRLLKI
jgi:hypothetical protein